VTDSASHTASATLSITVYATLTITTISLPATNAGTVYSQTLAAAGGTGTGYAWSVVSGASSLQAVGLSLSASGVISGTATAGTASFTVQVKDSASHTANSGIDDTGLQPVIVGGPRIHGTRAGNDRRGLWRSDPGHRRQRIL
jgi:hypothetical protein